MGRWIFLSTAVTYAAGYLDRLSLGRFVGDAQLGKYAVAFLVCDLVVLMGTMVATKVFFPILAETARENANQFYFRLRRIRLLWVVPSVAALVVLSLVGEPMVNLLYKPEFRGAGWMLRVMAAGQVMNVLNRSSAVVWPSLGEFRIITLFMVLQIPALLCMMVVGYHAGGMHGAVVGLALVDLIMYPLRAFLLARRKLWQPEFDFPVMICAGAIVGCGFWFV